MALPFKIQCDLITTPFVQVSDDWTEFVSACTASTGTPYISISTTPGLECGLEQLSIDSNRPNATDKNLIRWSDVLQKIDFADGNVIKAINSSLNNIEEYSNDLISNEQSKVIHIGYNFGIGGYNIEYIDRFGNKTNTTLPINDSNMLAIVSKILIEEQIRRINKKLIPVKTNKRYITANEYENVKKLAACLGVSVDPPTSGERKDLGNIYGLILSTTSAEYINSIVFMKRIKAKLKENAANGTFDGNTFGVSINFYCSQNTTNSNGVYDNGRTVSPLPWADRDKWIQDKSVKEDFFE